MAEGINANLKESSDLLSKVLDSLTKTSAAVDALPNKIKEVTKSLEAASKGFEGLAKAADGANAGQAGGSRMPWLARLGFGPKTQSAQPAAKAGGGGVGASTAPAAAQPGQGPTPKEVALTVGAGMAGMGAAAWAGTPGVTNAVTRQAGLFPMAFSTPGFVNSEKIDATNQRLRGLMGANLSGLYDDLAAANMTRYRGFGMNTPEFDSMMRTAGNMYALTGMSNPMSMQGSLAMYDAQGGSNLASVGIFTHDLATGKPKDVGQIVDELWRRGGWEGKNITLEQFETELGGGFLGAELKNLFGHDPGLYMQVVEAFRLKVKAKGRSGIKWNAPSDDPNSAKSVAQEMGLSDLAPWSVMGESNETRRNNLDSASEGLYSGFQVSENIIQGFNEALSQATDALGPFADIMYGLKGGFQDFSASGEGASMIQMASSMVGMIMPGLKLFMAEGGSASGAVTSFRGNSTSDSIPAMLSRGEYVINARSASILGTDYLDQLNSAGQEFGSGFASPAVHFARGGEAGQGDSVEASNQSNFPGAKSLSQVIALARKYSHLRYSSEAVVPEDDEGNPLRWGCATSVAWLYQEGAGVALPHPSMSQYQWEGLSGSVDPDEMQPGDLIFQKNNGPTGVNKQNAVNHVEMYLGPGEVFNGGMGIQSKSSYPPVQNGVKRVIGGGSALLPDSISENPSETPEVAGVMANAPSAVSSPGGSPEGLMNPMLAAQGISARWAQAFSLAPHGKRGNLLSTISHSLFPGMLAGSALTLFGGTAALMGSVGNTGVGADEDSSSEGEDSNIDYNVTASSGSGAEWLYQFLVAKGARGSLLRQLWTIAMRESGGNPNLVAAMDRGRFNYPDVPDDFNPDSESWRGGRYDVGLFQINSQHIGTVKSKFGGDMLSMIDPNNNFKMMGVLSGEFKNWKPWGITGFGKDGISYIDWSTWGPNWTGPGGWGATTEERTNEFWNQFPDYNKEGYSKGAWRTKEEIAQIHDGEMIIPAGAAEEFRKMMREAVSGGRASTGDVHINLTIARATEEEAMRFAKTVQKILKDDERLETMRTR